MGHPHRSHRIVLMKLRRCSYNPQTQQSNSSDVSGNCDLAVRKDTPLDPSHFHCDWGRTSEVALANAGLSFLADCLDEPPSKKHAGHSPKQTSTLCGFPDTL